MKKTLLAILVLSSASTSMVYAEEYDPSPDFGTNQQRQVQPQPRPQQAQPQSQINVQTQQPNQVYMPAVVPQKNTSNNKVRPVGGLEEVQYNSNTAGSTTLSAYESEYPMTKEQIKRQAFQENVETTFPLSEEQVREFNGRIDSLKKASAESTKSPAKPFKGEATVSFGANVDIPVISLDKDNLTTITFVDKNGFKWEVLAAEVGAQGFTAKEPIKNIQTNSITLSTTLLSGVTNLTIWLKDHPSPRPLLFTLVAGQNKVDYTFDVTVDADGPNTPVSEITYNKGPVGFSDTDDLKILKQGAVPKDLRALSIKRNGNNRVEAWASRDGKYVFLRTPMDLLGPQPIAAGRTLSNDYVYQIPRAETITFIYNGKAVQVDLGNFPASSYNY